MTNEKILIARISYERPDEKEVIEVPYTHVYLKAVDDELREWLFGFEGDNAPKPKLLARLREADLVEELKSTTKKTVTKESEKHEKAIADFNVRHGRHKPWLKSDSEWTEGHFEIGHGSISIRTPYDEGRGVKKHETRKALAIEWLKSQGIELYEMSCSLEYPADDCSRISAEARENAKQLLDLAPQQ